MRNRQWLISMQIDDLTKAFMKHGFVAVEAHCSNETQNIPRNRNEDIDAPIVRDIETDNENYKYIVRKSKSGSRPIFRNYNIMKSGGRL